MVEGYNRLYAGAYATSGYVTAVRAMIGAIQKRYDVDKRPPRGVPSEADGDDEEAGPEQTGFDW